MPRRPTRTVPTVLLPDPSGTSEQDWLPWLAGQLRGAGREVRLASWPAAESADLASCLAALRQSMAGLPDDGFDVLAHSAACLLWLHHAAHRNATGGAAGGVAAGAETGGAAGNAAVGAPRPARVALVAPPAPDRQLPAWD